MMRKRVINNVQVLQVLAIQLVAFAIELVTLALKFILLAIEYVTSTTEMLPWHKN